MQTLDRIQNGTDNEQSNNNDNDSSNIAGDIAFEELTSPTTFPPSSGGTYNHRTTHDSGESVVQNCIFENFMDKMKFPFLPRYRMKADVDSIYAYNTNLSKLIETFKGSNGDNSDSMMTMRNKVKPSRKAYGSRFFCDTSEMIDPPHIRGNPANKIGMERFPSIEIATFSVGLHRPLTVHLFNLGCSTIHKDAHFNKAEVAVITSCFNLARLLCRDHCRDNQDLDMQSSFIDCHLVKACYGNAVDIATPNEYNELTYKEAILFCSKFQEAMEMIASDEQPIYDFTNPEIHGIRQNSNEYQANKVEMKLFASELLKGACFVASLSGIKKVFNRSDFRTKQKNPSGYRANLQEILDNNRAALVGEANKVLCDKYQVESADRLPPDVNSFVDSGEEGLQLALEDISPEFDSFDSLFLNPWKSAMELDYTSNIKSLTNKVHSHLSKYLGNFERDKSIFFDIGIETRMKGNTSLLIGVKEAQSQMNLFSTLRYAVSCCTCCVHCFDSQSSFS